MKTRGVFQMLMGGRERIQAVVSSRLAETDAFVADLRHARGEGEMEKQEELEVLKSTGCVVLRSRTCSAPPRAPARTP